MKRLSAVLLMLLLAGGLAACEQEGPIEDTGEDIGDTMEPEGGVVE